MIPGVKNVTRDESIVFLDFSKAPAYIVVLEVIHHLPLHCLLLPKGYRSHLPRKSPSFDQPPSSATSSAW